MLIEQLREDRKHHVLDMGGPTRANVEFFEDTACRLYFAGLDEAVAESAASSEAGAGRISLSEADVDAAFDFDADVRFDIVLGWDLLNYFDELTLERVLTRVRRHVRPNTLTYFLIATTPEMSQVPAKFCMTRNGVLRYQVASAASVPAPRYTPRKLAQLMPGFNTLHMFLLRNGLQEYICRFQLADARRLGSIGEPLALGGGQSA